MPLCSCFDAAGGGFCGCLRPEEPLAAVAAALAASVPVYNMLADWIWRSASSVTFCNVHSNGSGDGSMHRWVDLGKHSGWAAQSSSSLMCLLALVPSHRCRAAYGVDLK